MAFSFSDLTDFAGEAWDIVKEPLWDTALDAMSATVMVYGTILGPVGIPAVLAGAALPGLARGEPTDRAIATGLKYQGFRGLNFILQRYGGDATSPQAAAEQAQLEESYAKPIERWGPDPNLRAEADRVKQLAAERGMDLDDALSSAEMTPEQLARRLSTATEPVREDAAAMIANIQTGIPFYDPSWFDPGSGRFISDLDTLVKLRAIARHRLAPAHLLAVLDRRMAAEKRRLGVPPPDVQDILNRPFSQVTSEELARVLQAAKDLGQPEPILDFIRGNYEMKLEEERIAERQTIRGTEAEAERNRPTFLQELVTATVLTAPAWVPIVLLPMLGRGRAGRRQRR